MADKMINVTFGFMDEDGNFRKIGELPDVDITEPEDDGDVIIDLLLDNYRLQGMVEAYEKVLGVDAEDDI